MTKVSIRIISNIQTKKIVMVPRTELINTKMFSFSIIFSFNLSLYQKKSLLKFIIFYFVNKYLHMIVGIIGMSLINDVFLVLILFIKN